MMTGSKPRDQEYLRGYGRGRGSSSLLPSHGAASSSPAATSGGSSTAEGRRHNNDDVRVPDNFAYSANTSKKSRYNTALDDGNGGIGGATRTYAIADAAAAAAALSRRSARRTGAVASSAAAAVADEATGRIAGTKVDARESRVSAEVTEDPGVNSLGCSVGGMEPIGMSQARNLGGASVWSAAAGRGRRVPLDGENGSCDATDAATTRRRVVMRKARKTYGR